MTVQQQDCGDLFGQLQVRGVSVELPCPSGIVQLEPADVIFDFDPCGEEEGWVGVVDRGTVVAIDPRIDKELRLEGLAREVVRRVQELRKKAGLEMEDRIELYRDATSDELREAIHEHKDYIAGETLVGRWADQPLTGPCHQASVNLDGHTLTIMLRKMSV